jgi:hypothetical protein
MESWSDKVYEKLELSKLRRGSWRWRAGSWKLEAGSWKLMEDTSTEDC